MKKCLILGIVFFMQFASFAQKHTVGLLSADNSKTFKGYNLMYPHEQPNVYLLDNCGKIVHQWVDNADSRPGNTVYLLDDGSILKTKRSSVIVGNPMWSGGGGGTVEKRDWNNNLLWTYTLNDSFNRLHHDIEPMANGNILMISWEKKTKAQAIAAGRNPSTVANGEIWPDRIIEVKPIGKDSSVIVWQWHLWDHLIQNFDSTKPFYGNPADNPGRINLNYATLNSSKNWAFMNAISYNESLDQIVVSSPSFNEIWIIDHSTTTAQAAGRSGGNSKKGGDLIYRWGNPNAYGQGTVADQKLFFPHDIHFMAKKFGEKDFGKLMVFNNRAGSNYSTVNIIETKFDNYFMEYGKNGNTYLPNGFFWTYKRPDSTAMYSSGLSSVQRLANGNTLICSAQQGYTFEITPSNEIIWEYVTPLKLGVRVSQGDTTLGPADNNTFRVKRYASTHPAFTGKTLKPIGYIELNPDTNFCNISLGIKDVTAANSVSIFPNPSSNLLSINNVNGIDNISISTLLGTKIYEWSGAKVTAHDIDVSGIQNGLYIISVNQHSVTEKVLIRH